jgi:parvulin-like peptidyl-prolyl isomerase
VKLQGEELAAFRRAVLESMIERRLLLAEAGRLQLSVTDREVDEALARRHGEGVPKNPEELARLRAVTRDQLLSDRALLREVVARVAIPPAEVKAFYEAHLEEFARGEQVRALQLVVPTRPDAEALRKELVRGTEFEKLAREQSTSPDARAGGDLGWFERGRMPPQFDEACFGLRKGQLSEVVETPYGFHLFKLVDRRAASVAPFATVEAAIELRLRRDAIARAQAAWLDRLRAASDVRIVDEELEKVQ